MLLTTNKELVESLDPAVQQIEQNGNYNLTSQYFHTPHPVNIT